MTECKRWLQTQLALVASLSDPFDPADENCDVEENQYHELGAIVREAERRSAANGLHSAVVACQSVRPGPLSPGIVRDILTKCLQTCHDASPRAKPDLLSVVAVAAMLDVSPSHVRRLADGGRLPKPIKVGNLVRWPRSELETWINQHGHRVPKAKR
ncbi:MAG: helix-turn-helix domain-containing protein [Planctomycetia bacterium]|nr:helix-turn-helix domain-containing protein [Planctomycetia bacterium]